jgi:hypothetical protein
MSLKAFGVIEIPGAVGSEFDHGIFDPKSRRVFIAHTRNSSIEVIDPDAGRHIATLPGFPGVAGAVADDGEVQLPSGGAHGLDIDHARERLYSACDAGDLVEVDSRSGEVTNVWPIVGPPDVTFFNPATGRVHVAIGEPGVIETIGPRTGLAVRTVTAADAHTTVLVPPDRLYVISPAHGGVLVLADA